MGTTVTLGGNRLGSGNKQKLQLHGFERSTHDLGYVWRNTQAPGTLVPFMSILGLPGDSFDINLGADVKTHPTVGPLFGSFKLQLDVFQCPIRLYNSWLHNNKLKIGMDMSQIKFPVISGTVNNLKINDSSDNASPIEEQQFSQSSLLAYLGLRGIGKFGKGGEGSIAFESQAIPYLAYWDIYKNYYANKQEELGWMIHAIGVGWDYTLTITDIAAATVIYTGDGKKFTCAVENGKTYSVSFTMSKYLFDEPEPKLKTWYIMKSDTPFPTDFFTGTFNYDFGTITDDMIEFHANVIASESATLVGSIAPDHLNILEAKKQLKLKSFQIDNIDEMRELILAQAGNIKFEITKNSIEPYCNPLKEMQVWDATHQIASYSVQEGLGLKTYQSDIFNNWLNTEWLEGEGGINELTAIDTSSGSFDINTLNLAQKVYDVLNRIAVSGGSYEDWVEAVYDNGTMRRAETPMYMGGLSKEIAFNEVISTAATEQNPLGTLAGRGKLTSKHKGGIVNIKINEPSFIIGIVSITPRVDYSQGNDWTTHLKNMDDLHKPSLDQIGFQDLLTDQLAFWDTDYDVIAPASPYKSAGKQPAWIDYMTNYNKLFGNFAIESNEMFMTLARRYENDDDGNIKDLTTYIDPQKFNYAFAQTDLSAQNFWVQIGCDIEARRKISARTMPNL